jgi:multicomponent Na+:H+ antiporter subunit B
MIPGILNGKNLMHGIWYKIPLGEVVEIKIGTPFIFDIGVFLTVIGVTVIFLLVLNRE